MQPFHYASIYARIEVRGKVREALMAPQPFVRWAKAQFATTPAMGTWQARQWVGAYLRELTGIPWLVTATDLDLADMPRHDPRKTIQKGEMENDDPLLPLPVWLIALTKKDVQGSDVVVFINQAPAPFAFDVPVLGKLH
jgi:hypothetical protein